MLNIKQKTPYDKLNQDKLKQHCISCTKCPLHSTRTNVVFGDGPSNADIMIIGEGPGEKEDLSGKPFIGRSGKLLTELLTEAELNRETDTYITNTVKCRPPKNRTPYPSEIEACNSYLIRQIQLIKPKILLLLGAPSLKTILDKKLAITKVRGQWFKATVDYMKNDLLIMPLFHPSYLLRFASKKEGSAKYLTQEDLKNVKKALTNHHL